MFGVALAVFCYWGMFTEAGRHSYDEMAGIIPLLAGVLAAVSGLTSAILFVILWRRRST